MPVKKIIKWMAKLISGQVLLVFAAFALMVAVSFIFVNDIERKHLAKQAGDAVEYTQVTIDAALREPATVLSSLAQTVRGMLIRGSSGDEVQAYMEDLTEAVFIHEDMVMGFLNAYGVLNVFGDRFVDSENWEMEGYVPTERHWYQAAVAAGGDIVLIPPYQNIETEELIITYARAMFDGEGRQLGVLAMDVLVEKVAEIVADTKITDGGYGILLDDDMNVIAHPSAPYIGKSLYDLNDGAEIARDIKEGTGYGEEREALSYTGERSSLFYAKLENGWYLGLMVPYREYYASVGNMLRFLIMLGVILAVMLSAALLSLAAQRIRSDEENRQKSTFMAVVSHEIRTPLNVILGLSEIQLLGGNLPDELAEAFRGIQTAGYTLLGIINDILDLSKIEAGKLTLILARYNTAALISDTVNLNMVRLGSKPLMFNLNVDPDTPAELFGDDLRIKQIMNNLLSNAFKYTGTGEVILSISSDKADGKTFLVFSVKDTGAGMSSDQVSRLFDEEYTRFQLEANRTTTGTGLGMNITKRLVDMMDGQIRVDSVLDEGTTVTVRLPQGYVGDAVIGGEKAETLRQFRFNTEGQSKKAEIVRTPMPYGRVLIVDDVDTNLFVAKGLMAPYGLTIESASSGFEAINKINSGKTYDVIFMDHMMPVMDGMKTTKNIREMGYPLPIVALTANALAGQADVFLSNGFDSFISKPIDLRQLNAVLNTFVRDRQPPEVVETARRQHGVSVVLPEPDATKLSPELCGIFIRDAEKSVAVLDEICRKKNPFDKSDDKQLYVLHVHSLKSALANVGEAGLSAAAARLEQAGRDRDTGVMWGETPEFLEALRNTVIKLKAVAARFDETAGQSAESAGQSAQAADGDEFLREKLLVIREVCSTFNKRAAKDAITELRKRQWPLKTKELLDAVSEALLHSDFDAILEFTAPFIE